MQTIISNQYNGLKRILMSCPVDLAVASAEVMLWDILAIVPYINKVLV